MAVHWTDFTIDYAGKGPRPLRRLVNRYITHEADFSKTYAQLLTSVEAATRQLDSLNAKLNIFQGSSTRRKSSSGSIAKVASRKRKTT
ncbi:unnamed protein product [Phytomonas sp. Hart1]|nr:unnamed protein product [Phytomonas sp. Hart1]|eukprot:CCW70966.1 unnamed protein product [Phytomonas sp. isolate Hart1]